MLFLSVLRIGVSSVKWILAALQKEADRVEGVERVLLEMRHTYCFVLRCCGIDMRLLPLSNITSQALSYLIIHTSLGSFSPLLRKYTQQIASKNRD